MKIYPTEITLPFADGEYRFFLPLAQVTELERAAEASMFAIEWSLREGIGIAEDGKAFFAGNSAAETKAIRNTVRLALIGGGRGKVDGAEVEVGPRRATELVDAYLFPAQPLANGAALAWRILATAIYGNELATVPAATATEGPTKAEEMTAGVEMRHG